MFERERSYDVFYRDYAHKVSISSAQPEPLDSTRLAPVAERLLTSVDNFFGVVDRDNNILQFYLDDDANSEQPQIVIELVFPENPGYYQAKLSLVDTLALLGKLPDVFGSEMLPGGRFIG